MVFKDTIEKMELFEGVRVTRITGSMNTSGNTDGMLEAIIHGGSNFPKTLLDYATNITQTTEVMPAEVYGNYAVQEQTSGPIKIEVTFKYDRKFLYLLDKVHDAELYKKHNVEADAFIEEWLSNG